MVHVPSLLIFLSGLVASQGDYRPYPPRDSYLKSTSILNHSSYIESFDEPQWYLDNIPFVDFPDEKLQQIYYYRASVLKRHLAYAHEGHGWTITEFIQPVPWASKFQTIPDSAPHQLLEARWLRDPSYVENVIQHYTRGGVETIAGVTYTHYLHRAIVEACQATGNVEFLTSQLEGMIYMYNLWNSTRDNMTGLYHRTPLLDAQEFSLPGYVTGSSIGGPVGAWNDLSNNFTNIWLGPETYRPDFNAYMIAGARSIADTAGLTADDSLAETWNNYAEELYSKMQNMLYSQELQFWIDVVQENNLRVEGRELIGLYPYRFDVGTEQDLVPGIDATLNEDIFLSAYGPTTLAQTNPYFTAEKNISYCCLWNGQSWPFSTCVYLGTLARLARENKSEVATSEFFYQALTTYTNTHYHQGKPAIFEAHYPHRDAWSAYTQNHSEHYLHSTYMDNIFTNLLGIVPALSETFEMLPLIPANWSNFVVENLPYHGTLLTILWDQSGTAYPALNHSVGLSIFSNGTLIHNQDDLTALNVSLTGTDTSAQYLAKQMRYANILANPNYLATELSLPYANATDTFYQAGNNLGVATFAYKTNDGLVFYDNPPDNYWTNNQTYFPASWLNYTLPRARSFSSLTVAVYADDQRNGSIACPASIHVYASKSSGNASNQEMQPQLIVQQTPWESCLGNSRNTLTFNTSITADTISLYFVNALQYAVAIAEVEIWLPANQGPTYHAVDGIIGYYSQGAAKNTNGTIKNGGVQLNSGGILELAGIKGPIGQANLTVNGYGGDVMLMVNYLYNVTITLPDAEAGNTYAAVELLPGENVFTFFQSGNNSVWLGDMIVGLCLRGRVKLEDK